MVLRSIPGLLSLYFMATLMSCCFIRVVSRPLAADRLSRLETNSGEREEEAAYTHNLSNRYLASNCVAILGINGVVHRGQTRQQTKVGCEMCGVRMCDVVISGRRHYSPVMFRISVGCPHFRRAVLARYHLS